jgi:hypothetical protein
MMAPVFVTMVIMMLVINLMAILMMMILFLTFIVIDQERDVFLDCDYDVCVSIGAGEIRGGGGYSWLTK